MSAPQDSCRNGNSADAAPVPTVAQAAAAAEMQRHLTHHHHAHLISQPFALGAGPHATLVSQRWNEGREASLLEILDAALEIAEAPLAPPLTSLRPPKSSPPSRKRRAPGSHPGRE